MFIAFKYFSEKLPPTTLLQREPFLTISYTINSSVAHYRVSLCFNTFWIITNKSEETPWINEKELWLKSVWLTKPEIFSILFIGSITIGIVLIISELRMRKTWNRIFDCTIETVQLLKRQNHFDIMKVKLAIYLSKRSDQGPIS